MAKKSGASKQDSRIGEILRLGGMKIPAGFAGKATAATKALLRQKLEAGSATRKRAMKLYSELKGASPVAVNDPANAQALAGLLSLHKKLAGTKPAFPKVPPGIGVIFPGTIGGTIVPPFEFADYIPTVLAGPTPTMSVSANVNGQISASVASLQALGFNGGNEYARVGFFFHPMTSGTLTIASSPTYSFAWSTNSLNSSFVESAGGIGLTIYGMNDLGQIPASGGANYESWEDLNTGEIGLGFASNVQKSLSTSLEVDPSLVYLCFVEVDAGAAGMGWPGSLATAMASATVPSISYEFVPRLVINPVAG